MSSTVSTAPAGAPQATSGAWLGQTWRLTLWELFTAWRRVMSKVLLGILLGLFVLIIGFVLLGYLITQNAPVQGQTCGPAPVVSTQSSGGNGNSGNGSGNPQVQCQPLSAQDQQQIRDQETSSIRATLTFPSSVQFAGGYTAFMGVILLAILAGAVIGGEFGFGTVRLALSRGVGRAQLLTAQVVALALLSLGISLVMVLLGIIAGFTIGPLLGATVAALPSGGGLALVTYWLAVSLHLFAFAAIAFLLATLARSTAAGIAVPLGYYIFEVIATGILSALSFAIHGNVGDFLGHVPDWFLGQNLSVVAAKTFAPLQPASGGIQSGGGGPTGPTFDLTHGLLVSLAYCVVLIGATYFIMRRRDITD